jgi:beta-mannanase
MDSSSSRAWLAVPAGFALAALTLLLVFAGVGGGSASALPPGCGPAGTATTVAGIALTAEQMGNAQTVATVTASRGLPSYAAVVAEATAYQESRLINLDHGDTAGPDSRGLFQQRPSQGWGTPAQVLDPTYATNAFLDALLKVPNWQTIPLTVAAQTVQVSAYPDAYAQWQALGEGLVGLLWPQAAAGSGGAQPSVRVAATTNQPAAATSGTTPAGPTTPSRPGAKLSPATGAYVGAYSSTTGLTTAQSVETYFQQRETLAGRKFAIQNYMPGWSQPLDNPIVRWDLSQQIIPLISWNSPDGVSARSIADGSQDSVIKAQAARVKSLGSDVFLRLDWEMNGNWFPWAGDPAGYVAMWRHIHDLFTAAGATNVAWVWTPSAQSLPNTPGNAMTAYYPGDAYVDWAGEDDYNYGGTAGHAGGWNDFTSELQPLYRTFSTRKPIMIGEMGSVDHIPGHDTPGHDKGQWIATMAAQIKADYPDVQALVWFDVTYDADWRFDTSPSSLAAFKAWVADPYYNPTSTAVQALCPGGGGDGPVGTGTSSTTLPTGFTITGTPAGTKAVQYALAQLGKPYAWGGAGPDVYDCSGLTLASWAAAGVTLAHSTAVQVSAGTPGPTDLSQAQAGDLVFIPGSDGTPTDPRHVGMVAGTVTDAAGVHLYLIQAPHTGANVELTETTAWSGRIVDVRRIG